MKRVAFGFLLGWLSVITVAVVWSLTDPEFVQ